jgi:hypothetical protein
MNQKSTANTSKQKKKKKEEEERLVDVFKQ